MKIYVAGPMSGLPELNYPAFHAAAKALRDAGYTVVNPAELNKGSNACWYECMRVDIRELVTCDSIFLLPNWTMSRGARLEFHIASQLSMQVIEAQTYLPEPQIISFGFEPDVDCSELQKQVESVMPLTGTLQVPK